jgi:AbrB family looped-hinge helix DNA binding protein
MSDFKTRIGKGGRIVIPSRYRRAIGAGEGDEVILSLEENGLRILTPQQAVRQAQELVRRYVPAGRSLARELLEERRREAERE